MFSSLSKGSILYGMDRRGEAKPFTGTVESVSLPMPVSAPTVFGQMPETVVDIVATVDGERKEFKKLPSGNAVADFGPESFVLADNRDSLVGYVSSQLQASRNVLDSVDRHKALVAQYEGVLASLSPEAASNAEVKRLKDEMGGMKSQLDEILALLKPKAQNA